MKKKLISYSLYGDRRLYCIGAIKNALLAEKYFKGWICRFYYDSTVPKIIIDYLSSLDNVELFYIEKPSGSDFFKDRKQFGMFWRFYPLDDDDVSVFLIRDVDSRLSEYEFEEINNFLETNNVIHSFRSDLEYSQGLPCRGCGTSFKNFSGENDNRFVNGTKLNLQDMISSVDRDNCGFSEEKGWEDEYFLNEVLYPKYKDRYQYSQREFRKIEPKYCGPWVGGVVDEYDNRIDKYTNHSFNFQRTYGDLSVFMSNYKKEIL